MDDSRKNKDMKAKKAKQNNTPQKEEKGKSQNNHNQEGQEMKFVIPESAPIRVSVRMGRAQGGTLDPRVRPTAAYHGLNPQEPANDGGKCGDPVQEYWEHAKDMIKTQMENVEKQLQEACEYYGEGGKRNAFLQWIDEIWWERYFATRKMLRDMYESFGGNVPQATRENLLMLQQEIMEKCYAAWEKQRPNYTAAFEEQKLTGEAPPRGGAGRGPHPAVTEGAFDDSSPRAAQRPAEGKPPCAKRAPGKKRPRHMNRDGRLSLQMSETGHTPKIRRN